jgi:hypothetical protein
MARNMAGTKPSRLLPSVSSSRIFTHSSSPLTHHGHKLLLLAPIVEGIFGGQATHQAVISAYISYCTSDGSRAHIFSRFARASYSGFGLGPILGISLIRHPLLQSLEAQLAKELIAVVWTLVLDDDMAALKSLSSFLIHKE